MTLGVIKTKNRYGKESSQNDHFVPTFKFYRSFDGSYYDVNEISQNIAWTSQATEFIDYMNVIADCNGDLGGFVFDGDGDCVCDDADVSRAVNADVWGVMSNAGQTCISVERIFFHNKIMPL